MLQTNHVPHWYDWVSTDMIGQRASTLPVFGQWQHAGHVPPDYPSTKRASITAHQTTINFAHAVTAVLLRHCAKKLSFSSLQFGGKQNKKIPNLNKDWKRYSVKWASGLIPVYCLNHWGRVMHICVGNLTIIGSAPSHYLNQCCNIVRNKLQWNFHQIKTFSLKKMRSKVSSGKRRPSCLGLNVLTTYFALRCPQIPLSWPHYPSYPIAIVISHGNDATSLAKILLFY